MRIHRDERGQTIILVALSLPILLGFIGIATDVGALFKDKRTLQTAADAAAIAGALNLPPGSTSITTAAQTAATAAATTNGFTNGSNGVVVTVNDPPLWPGSNYGNPSGAANGYVEVTITKPEPTIFLALFGYPSVTVLARAVASNNGPGACLFAGIGTPTGTPLTVVGNMQAAQCGVVVDSSNSPPLTVTGSLTAASIGVVGDCSSGCAGTSPQPTSHIIPYGDPLAFLPQTAPGAGSCTNTFNATGGTVVLFPGCYTTFNETGAAVTLNPGTYVINTGVNAAQLTGGTLTGTGVTLYVNSGNLMVTGTTMNLSAPIGGTFNGILFQQSSADVSNALINGNPSSNLQGFFYFPTSTLQLSGTFATFNGGFVAQSLSINANPNLTINSYASLPGVTSPIFSAVLVE
jgi:hypothetical protein